MSRFFRFSRIRPAELYRERLRQMRRAATLSFALLPGIAALLLLGGRFLPRGAQAASSGDAELRNPTAFATRPAPASGGASSAGAAAANSAALSRLPQLPLPDSANFLPPHPATASDALSSPLEGGRLAELPPLPVENAAAEPQTYETRNAETNDSEPPLPDAALAELLSLAPAPAPTESPEPETKPAADSSPSGKPESATSSSSDGRRSTGTSPAAAQGASSRTASTDSASSATASSTSASAGSADEAPDTPPRYREAPPPPYPAAMRAGHYRGEVVVLIEVGADGRPESVRILRSAGRGELDCAARDWILAHWSFYPAERDGRRVASRVRTSIRFEGH